MNADSLLIIIDSQRSVRRGTVSVAISPDALVERVFSTVGLSLVRVPARLTYDTREIRAAK